MTNPSYRTRGGYRSAGSLRPVGSVARINRPIMTSHGDAGQPTKDELREMLAEAVRNTADREQPR